MQGTPLTYYYAFYQPDVQDPAMKALRMMDYDLFVTGNHEYNYGMDILSRQLADLTAPPAEGEDEVWVSMADYLDAATNSDEARDWATWNGYDPSPHLRLRRGEGGGDGHRQPQRVQVGRARKLGGHLLPRGVIDTYLHTLR